MSMAWLNQSRWSLFMTPYWSYGDWMVFVAVVAFVHVLVLLMMRRK